MQITGGSKPPPYHRNSISCVGNGLDRSANLPIYWGRLPHSVREMSRSDRGRPPPSAGGSRKARDGGANHIKIDGRARRPAPTNGSSRTPTPTHEIECIYPHKPQFVLLRRNPKILPSRIFFCGGGFFSACKNTEKFLRTKSCSFKTIRHNLWRDRFCRRKKPTEKSQKH